MGQKATYQVTGRQILVIGLVSAFLAVAGVLLVLNLGNIASAFQSSPTPKNAKFNDAEKPMRGVSDPSVVSDEQNSIEVYKAAAPGVAFITTSARFETFFGEEFERKSGSGSGSVIDDQGHILTNYHVIEGASKLTVSFGGEKLYTATYVGGDPDTDLAVIKVKAPRSALTKIPFGDSKRLVVGQKVLAIGNPFGLDRTLTTGVISGLERPIRAKNRRPIDAAIQTDASINPGNSGGPLLDKFGRMVGINTQILSPSGGSAGVGFAVPVNTAKQVVPQLIQFGEVRRPKLGAGFRSVEALSRRYELPVSNGILITNVYPGSSADQAGLLGFRRDEEGMLLGDIILKLDGSEINDGDDLYRALNKRKIGDTVNVEIFREGERLTKQMKLVPQPSNRGERVRRF